MAQLDTEANPDGQLELKKRARRRLVGAAALALLAAIVLPVVMDHEPRQPVQDVQVRIPSQDGGGIAARILPNRAAPTPLPPAPPDSDVDAKSDVKSDVKSETAPEAKPIVEPKPAAEIPRDEKPATKPAEKPAEQATARPAEKAAEKPAAKLVEKSAAKPVEKPADKVAAAKAEEARARAALKGESTSAGESWLVLIGAYKDEANVKQLTAKLKQIGVPVLTEKFDSPQGPRTRVRAGPFKTRNVAEQALAKMKKVGISGPIAQSGK